MSRWRELRKSRGRAKRKRVGLGRDMGLRLSFGVKLRLEEGLPVFLLSKETGVSKSAVHHWVKAYQERGEAGLRTQGGSSGSRKKLPVPVREKIKNVTVRVAVENCDILN